MTRRAASPSIACLLAAVFATCSHAFDPPAIATNPAEPDLIELELYGELPFKSKSHVNSIAFQSDGVTFAMPVDDGKVGVFRIKPEPKDPAGPITAAERRTVTVLVDELTSPGFADRERATRELKAYGVRIEAMLREAAANPESFEARRRLRRLLKAIAAAKAGNLTDRVERVAIVPGLKGDIRSLDYSTDDRRLLVAGYDAQMRILDGRTHRPLGRVPVDESVGHAMFSPDGRRILAGVDGKVGIWNVETLERETTLDALPGDVYCLDVSPDGRWLACSGVPRAVSLWDLKRSRRVRLLEGFGNSVGHLDFSPDGRHLACASEDGTVTTWNVETGKRVRTMGEHADEVWVVTYSPDGSTIASSSRGGETIFWDTGSGRVLKRLAGKSSSGRHVVFSPTGRHVVTATAYGRTQVWKRPGQPERPR